MKTNFIKSTVIISGLLLSGQVFAQESSSEVKPFQAPATYRTWSIGIHGGALTPELLFGRNDFTGAKASVGYGVSLKKQVLHSLGFRADFLRGKLEGTSSRNGSYTSFKTDVPWSGSINADFTFANVNWLNGKSSMLPYISAGVGTMSYSPVLNYNTVPQQYKPDGNIYELFFPVGIGAKFTLSKGINLDLGYQMNFVDEDNLDGYSDGYQFDKFAYAHAGLEFSLGSSAKPQLAVSNPVKVMYDDYVSKDNSLKAEMAAQKAATENALAAQKASTQAQIAELQGQLKAALADTDGDGVIDKLDKCSGTPSGTKVDGSGCPLPEVVNTTTTTIITEQDRAVVRDAIKNLEFDSGKATIRAKSYPSLNRVASLLTEKNFSLKLAGHTDDVGSDAANLKLSKDRAESIKAYLVSKGANPSRIEATGYGESQPIATNKTAAGKQMNRRVEFTIY